MGGSIFDILLAKFVVEVVIILWWSPAPFGRQPEREEKIGFSCNKRNGHYFSMGRHFGEIVCSHGSGFYFFAFYSRCIRDGVQGHGPCDRGGRGTEEDEVHPHGGRGPHGNTQGNLTSQTAAAIWASKHCQVRIFLNSCRRLNLSDLAPSSEMKVVLTSSFSWNKIAFFQALKEKTKMIIGVVQWRRGEKPRKYLFACQTDQAVFRSVIRSLFLFFSLDSLFMLRSCSFLHANTK